MKDTESGKEMAKIEARMGVDRGESIALIEPLVLSETSPYRSELQDLALHLAQKSAGFQRSLPKSLLTSLATLVRAMNCYYSNLIEGHDTHPIDIERALQNDYSGDPRKRDLQMEARAHIAVQQWIDEGGLAGGVISQAGILEIHRRFGELLPADLLSIQDPQTQEKITVVPGQLRERDVVVGKHVPVSPGAVARFLERFESGYQTLGRSESILALAAAHHRLLWIHPFLDGNGRVARLFSHAMSAELLQTGSVWSVARGLGRQVQMYKQLLANCDLQRRNDLDGRGNLSEEALVEFTRFFLKICIDQVNFMEGLMQPDRLRARILVWVEEEIRLGTLHAKSGVLLQSVLYRGELPRGDAAAVVSGSERNASRIVTRLIEAGVLTSASSRAPLHLAFPATLASRWMPGLFPDKPD